MTDVFFVKYTRLSGEDLNEPHDFLLAMQWHGDDRSNAELIATVRVNQGICFRIATVQNSSRSDTLSRKT
jgi:hypothetical protein